MKMNDAFLASMREAMHLLQTAGPLEATEAIQRALREQASMGAAVAPASPSAPMPAQVVERLLTDARAQARPADVAGSAANAAPPASARGTHSLRPDGKQASPQDVSHFSQRTFVNRAGSRAYKLYVPAGRRVEPMPLVVMLHGCTQDADDFAAGTQMNALADMLGFVVLYPIQAAGDNPSKCWNWFRPGDQQAGKGEPSIIAGMAREVIASHGIDARRVYVAGLSAGGAMAAVLIQRYPELFAAAGVHSGLPAGSAHDLPSALGAMKGGKGLGRSRSGAVPPASTGRPIIVFHGDADHTVHPSNGDRLVAPFKSDHARQLTERRNVAGGHDYTRHRITTPAGVNVEYWIIHGAGHAWAGGSPQGSYTDPKGPDASAEMLRFFLANPLPG
ncbi:extracellular catalytic domain type 1 short-chain-length polyhydroxyalkanoate depolymerase [Cupriavidus oxalaticus]|uniref:PHB depolymerase family esterase n=1 Tax=Cupriavidus oxalaticus TaxID=96344 RepID=A0A4P7LCA5_9BURK|nr:PHB depolymerase family esterase [Cupriavidus oxalaticus]QBY53165.1 PHB depolymerase family esterase [Cupriavidus oxalaticus]